MSHRQSKSRKANGTLVCCGHFNQNGKSYILDGWLAGKRENNFHQIAAAQFSIAFLLMFTKAIAN